MKNTYEASWQPVFAAAGLPAERTDTFTQAHYDALVGVGAISGLAAFLNWYKDWIGRPIIDGWAAANPLADVNGTLIDGADLTRRIASSEPLGSLLLDVPGLKEAGADLAARGAVVVGIVAMGLIGMKMMVSGAGLPLHPIGRLA